jgi:hypothetical protein
MAAPELVQDKKQLGDPSTDATAEVFLLAFKALPDKYQQAVLRKLLSAISEEMQPAAQILAAIDRDRWTPPPGSPDSLILLREDRSR